MPKSKSDFTVVDSGSIVSFTPNTPEAKRFCEEDIEIESWQWMGESFHVDHRMASGLISFLQDNEFSLK